MTDKGETRARLASTGGWGQVGCITDARYAKPIVDGRRRRKRCQQGVGCPNRVSHYGWANGVVLMAGCHLHVLRWVRDGGRVRAD